MQSTLAKILAVMLLVATHACSKAPTATRQEQGVVAAPAWPEMSPRLGLAARPNADVETWDGSLLIWDKRVSVEQMARVITAARDNRVAKSRVETYARTTLRPAEEELRGLRLTRDDLQARAGASEGVRAARLEFARDWFGKRLAGLAESGVLDAAGVDRTQRIFAAYCEAKLWDLAAFGDLALTRWTTVPTPLALCAGVYADRGLLNAEAPECAAAMRGESDWVSCLWSQGVLKTEMFGTRYDNVFVAPGATPAPTDIERAAKLRAWIGDGTLAAILAQTDALRRPGVRNAIMGQRVARPMAFNVNGANNNDFRSIFVPREGTPTGAVDSPLALMSPEFLINQIESASLDPAAIATEARLIDGIDDVARREALVTLRREIADFGAREFPSGASVSDWLFNAGIPAALKPARYDLVREGSAFGDVFSAVSQEYAELIATNARAIAAAESRLAELRLESSRLENGWSDAMQSGLRVAVDPGATSAFWTKARVEAREFSATAAAGRVVRIMFRLGPEFEHVGACLDLSSTAASVQVTCPEDVRSAHLPVLMRDAGVAAAFDQATGRLELVASIDDPAAFGLGERIGPLDIDARSNGFNDLSPASLVGLRWRLELFSAQLDGLPILTGKIEILSADGSVVHEGATSLMPYN